MKHERKETVKDLLWFYRRQAVGLCVLLTVLGLLAAANVTALGKGQDIQQGIAGEILRFHVIANSDSRQDQDLKLAVRDEVVTYMEGLLSGAEDMEETRSRVQSHLGEIEARAKQVVEARGASYPVRGELTSCYFPRKSYGDCTFPAGRYQALRLCIGKAEGKNWWCVLFPNLCFLDSVHAVLPKEQKQKLKNVLTEEEYESLFDWKRSKVKITCRLFRLAAGETDAQKS